MSTLVTHHDGLDRVLRGWDFVNGKRHGRGGVKGSDRSRRAVPESKPAVEQAAPVAVARPSILARMVASWKRRSEDARFEALMREDPRVRAEYLAAKSRAEWQE